MVFQHVFHLSCQCEHCSHRSQWQWLVSQARLQSLCNDFPWLRPVQIGWDAFLWIGFHGKIYRKPWFLPSNIGGSCKFSHHPILWISEEQRINGWYTLNIIESTRTESIWSLTHTFYCQHMWKKFYIQYLSIFSSASVSWRKSKHLTTLALKDDLLTTLSNKSSRILPGCVPGHPWSLSRSPDKVVGFDPRHISIQQRQSRTVRSHTAENRFSQNHLGIQRGCERFKRFAGASDPIRVSFLDLEHLKFSPAQPIISIIFNYSE